MKLNFRRGSAFASKKGREYVKNLVPQDVQNITVIRHAAIGDFMNIRPFLVELRIFFPNARITLSVIESYMYGMPEDLVDAIHVIHKQKADGSKTNFLSRHKEMKALPAQDIIFDLTDSTLSLLLIIFSQAEVKIGYSYRAIRRFFYDIATLRSDFVLEALSIEHMLNILGANTAYPLKYAYEKEYPKEKDLQQIVYFAGASKKSKCWKSENFISLIDKMSRDYPHYKHIILQGIGEDEKFYDLYDALTSNKNVYLQKLLPIKEVMQFLKNSRCLVCNDTGVRNMGIALEIPTVGIFFEIPPFRYWPREEKHECVFNKEYVQPTVEDVYTVTKELIDKLYDK